MSDKAISHHILPVSSQMVGLSLTTISILRLLEMSHNMTLFIDAFMAFDSLVFLASSVLSYLSIRSLQRGALLEKIADIIFLMGLAIMVISGFLLTYEFGVKEVIKTSQLSV